MRKLALTLVLWTSATNSARADNPETPPPRSHSKLVAASAVGGIHLAYATWSYFAWYRNANSEDFHLEHSHLFSPTSYAGGADKLGHAWSNYVLTRATTAVLTSGGWRRGPSSFVAAGLTEIAFTLTEIQDGYVFGFDRADVVANLFGAGFALVMENIPAVDRLLDFRLQYIPSRDYRQQLRDNGSVDVGQDYTGQSYVLALHLGALPAAETRDYLYWTRFVDFAIGFEAHHYWPRTETPTDEPRQTVYIGLAVNMQGVLSHLLADSSGRRIGRGTFEVFALPYTTFRFIEGSRSP